MYVCIRIYVGAYTDIAELELRSYQSSFRRCETPLNVKGLVSRTSFLESTGTDYSYLMNTLVKPI